MKPIVWQEYQHAFLLTPIGISITAFLGDTGSIHVCPDPFLSLSGWARDQVNDSGSWIKGCQKQLSPSGHGYCLKCAGMWVSIHAYAWCVDGVGDVWLWSEHPTQGLHAWGLVALVQGVGGTGSTPTPYTTMADKEMTTFVNGYHRKCKGLSSINPYTTCNKEMTFCTIFVNRYIRNAKVYLQSRSSMKIVGLAVDIWSNKVKFRNLLEAWEVRQFRISNMTTKIVLYHHCDISNTQKSIQPNRGEVRISVVRLWTKFTSFNMNIPPFAEHFMNY